ncbi:Uncharacterized conserved protein, DUF58 family, contains vWF domain [Formivibrio citricus]|uniref:Uncharacterized conserved protein, DUF58 family, contains vWF domain n=1 Tax=Formivibrio citricus TaxID=83765 RepID=A0A1I4Y926_9NEIS|nr:DUF58 domain-containing protein [Formivibrio citricus]SFN34546.1 Uncharacterized conserved protein, DUF58 family, contains vWF domain [Formivibrio citricus]
MNLLGQRWQTFIARRHPPASGSLALVHKRIYIVPTRRGLGLGLLLLISLVGAINYQLSLGFFFTFLLAGIAHSALLRTYAALLGLEIAARPAEAVFAGEAAQFPLALSEKKGRERTGITLLSPDGSATRCDVPQRGEARAAIAVAAPRRGRLTLPRSRIECRAPTGWFVAWSYLTLVSECLVYPRPEANPPPLPFGARSGGGGLQAGQGDDDFAGLREYHPGDAPSRIAWRQAARTDTLLAKTFQSPLASQVLLDWEMLAGLDTEARLSRLAAWILRAEAEGHRYALVIPGFSRPLDHGAAHRAACLAALALFPAEGSGA